MINKHLSSYPSFSNEADIFLDKNVKAECMTSVLQCVLAYIQGLVDAIFGYISQRLVRNVFELNKFITFQPFRSFVIPMQSHGGS